MKCTVYNIGGELTQVLSLTCSKQLPMIPHVGVRLYGTEYFYSDVIESRPVAVMQDMLEDFPQVSFDLGPATVTEAELEEWIASDALQSRRQPGPIKRLRPQLQPLRARHLRQGCGERPRGVAHAAGHRRHGGDALELPGRAQNLGKAS